MNKIASIVSVLLAFAFSESNSLDITSTFDIPCLNPAPTVARNVDYAWMHSVDLWYIPLQSKLNFYRYSESLLKTRISNVTETEVSPSTACIYFRWDTPPKLYGFSGTKSATYVTTRVYENSYGFDTKWEGDTRGRHYITLRDNINFVLFTTCWADGQASWSVISTNETISEDARKNILDHVQAFGFNTEEQLLEQDYSLCSPTLQEAVDKNEL